MMTSPASLSRLKAELDTCRRCPLYKHATQGVPGEGPRRARLMLVGEQPGNDEDLAGRPFVGPAGKMLDRALDEAGVDRAAVFVTNAVKHFKFEQRGKRRLHKRPNAHEIERCRWWLDKERALVKPVLTVALGATAARSLLGKAVTIAKVRGKVLDLPDGTQGLVTIHPSLLLRIPDARGKAAGFKSLTRDLREAWRIALAS
ncbi:MAG TPA: UdgX family uracil-DNA binding protein [Rhizomicrobium sp.]|jgi:DNA polymerase|nr:UdgX family uracil-DNA binding protein [Rhizomicrobium sp.]